MNILAADIGGTKTLLALARPAPDGWRFECRTRFASGDYPALEPMLERWLGAVPAERLPLSGIGLALAGPVGVGGGSSHATVTNLAWPRIDALRLSQRFGAPVTLLNDFAAIGASLSALVPGDSVVLQQGQEDPLGLRLVAGAGTGLGTCLVGPAPRHTVFPGEGGHADFAPADDWEAKLAEWIRARLGRCSREHVLSGPGIGRIAAFLHELSPDPVLAGALSGHDPAAAIGVLAQQGEPGALRVVERFVRIYGSQLGNLALAALPSGGVYIAGGIAPRWLGHFRTPAFRDAFCNKPPMHDLLAGLTLRLITHPEPGLLGAAVAAYRNLESAGEPA
jgi:glucokinase